jgi:hypothetical protein
MSQLTYLALQVKTDASKGATGKHDREKVNKKEVAYVGQTGSLILSTLYLHEKHNSLVL